MKQKLGAVLLTGMLAAVALTGCNSVAEPENTKAAETPAAQEADRNGAEAESGFQTEEPTAEETEIYVFIAASLQNAMTEIQQMYEEAHPEVTIRYQADSSGTLQTQIEEGAECDLFFSAAEKQMQELEEEGYLIEGSVVDLLENKVVLIQPAGAQTEVTSFADIPKAANLALAGEDVPVGQYAREIFANLGILDAVMEMEINEGKNVTEVLAAVSEGSNEVGVVYATDAASVADAVEVLAEAPAESLDTPVLYPVGQVENQEADDAQKAAASAFAAYLQTPEALEVFASYGFAAHEGK